ncbi:MAG: MucR family transcriptional regulator, partial [Sphingomonadaceae bacterium]|nr:MucR family transcriptional regulator [Sphingomonadaceae bacterium]
AEIVSAFVANNSIKSQEVASLIRETHGALAALGAPQASEAAAEPVFTPAVGVRKSLASRDHLLSLIDGKPYKTLKRHLSRHGLTPSQYRERYGLPKTYPMVAPAYSEARSEVAKKLGLGQRARAARAEAAGAADAKPAAGRKRGRPPKAAPA